MLNTVWTSWLYHSNAKTLPTLLIIKVVFISQELHQPYLDWLGLLVDPGSNAFELRFDEHKRKKKIKITIYLSGESSYNEVEIGPQHILSYLQEEDSVSTCRTQGAGMVYIPAIFTCCIPFF